ncbi:hypothetical protein SDC9_156777 [bioreactor metagenome]|uniref:Uncharacterized protein n=1 Tax=bioreactor metagenome TaxID=1076179 RepID=A0A645F5M6_9ZZZZ
MVAGFDGESPIHVNFSDMGFEFFHLGGGDQIEFYLGLRQRHPQAAPDAAFVDLSPQGTHFCGPVTPTERTLIALKVAHGTTLGSWQNVPDPPRWS